jgi:sulfopyruvate decarboxylase subunit beta
MDRLEATRLLVSLLDKELVVANLGSSSCDLYEANNRPENLYMLGGLGLPSSVGLGLSLAVNDRKVIVLDGDGSVLMNLGSLATIAQQSPSNLVHIIWDNQQWGETGGQPTATSTNTDLSQVARGAGISQAEQVSTLEEFHKVVKAALMGRGPWCIVARVEENGHRPWPPNDPVANVNRFMSSLQ